MRTCIKLSVWALMLLIGGGMLVVAVNRTREAAARSSCKNNLRQIGLTFHNYHDANGSYPTATMPNSDLAPDERLSWMVMIVPYVECGNLYSDIKKKNGGSWQSPSHEEFRQTRYPVFLCPGDPATGPEWPSHYVGISGIGADAVHLPITDKRCGILGHERQVKETDVTDGTSQTLIAIETARDNGPWIAGGNYTVRGVVLEDPPFVGDGAQFGRLHTGPSQARWFGLGVLATALYVDGSVRTLRTPSADVMGSLATIAGGEPRLSGDF